MVIITVGTSHGTYVIMLNNGKFIHSGRKGYSGAPNHYTAYYCRYNSDGSLDTSFADNGIYTYDAGCVTLPASIFIDSQDRIYCTNSVKFDGTNYERVIFRLTEDGELDTSYADNGFYRYTDDQLVAGGSVVFRNDGEFLIPGFINDENVIVGIDEKGNLLPGN